MNPTLKKILVAIAKNAIGTALTTPFPMAIWHSEFNFRDVHGWQHMLMVWGSVIGAQELKAVVLPWGLKGYQWLLAWANSPTPES